MTELLMIESILKKLEYYDSVMNGLENVGDSIVILGAVYDVFAPYFAKQGCRIELIDFGIEETIVRRVEPKKKTIVKAKRKK